jgi:hypothetical protein
MSSDFVWPFLKNYSTKKVGNAVLSKGELARVAMEKGRFQLNASVQTAA